MTNVTTKMSNTRGYIIKTISLAQKNIKQHQKINRRLQRSPMKLVQKKSTEFQKPRKSKKAKTPKRHSNETEAKNIKQHQKINRRLQ